MKLKSYLKKCICLVMSLCIISVTFSGCKAQTQWAIASFNSIYNENDFLYAKGLVYYWDKISECIFSFDLDAQDSELCVDMQKINDNEEWWNRKVISRPFLNYLNDNLYFVYRKSIYSYNCSTKKCENIFDLNNYKNELSKSVQQQIDQDYSICFLNVSSKYLVFVCGDIVFRLNVNSSDPKIIFNSHEQMNQNIDCITADKNKLSLTYCIGTSENGEEYRYKPSVKNVFIDTDSGESEVRYSDEILDNYDCYFFGDYEVRVNIFDSENVGVFYKDAKVSEISDSGDNIWFNTYNDEFYYFDSEYDFSILKINDAGIKNAEYYFNDFVECMYLQQDGILVWLDSSEGNPENITFQIYDLKSSS